MAAAPLGRRAVCVNALAAGAVGAQAAGLRSIAAARGITFGVAVEAASLRDGPLAQAIAAEAGMLVPENDGKWRRLRPGPDAWDARGMEQILAFAARHGQSVRGHTMIWHTSLPEWLPAALAGPGSDAEGIMRRHIGGIAARFGGRIRDWDVVNEAVADQDALPVGLRDSPWLRALGPDYGALAFRLARETDPGCRLVLNDYGLEADVGWQEAKRARLLSILRTWLDAGAPIDAVGVQGHLLLHDAFSPAPFAAFVRSIRALGLEVLVTELDVQEPAGPLPDIATRDAAVAERTYAFVSTALEHGVRTVLCWGLSDAQSWLNLHQPTRRADGVQVRGLPLDAGLNRKPMWDALARAFRGA